jgi:hypothetical protein
MSFVVKAVKSVVKAVVNVVKAVVKAVVNVVSSVINFVTQPFMGLLGGQPDIPNAAQESERQQGVLLQREGSNVNIPIIYGYRKVGGVVTFAETGSTKNKFLYVAYVLAEGPVEGIREVFIDDWQLPAEQAATLNAGNLITVANDPRYGGRVQLQFFPGTYFNNPINSPLGSTVKTGIFAEAPSFTTDMVYNGLAVLFARYEWLEITSSTPQDVVNNNPFGGNIPVIQASVLGRRIASLEITNPQDFTYETAVTRFSYNPAEILLDYLRNPRYGKGLKNDDIDWASWKTAAAKCNTTVTYLTGNGTTGAIMTCSVVIDTSATIMSNVKTLLMGFRAYMPYIQGKYKLKIEDAGHPTDILSGAATIAQTFTKDDMLGSVIYTGIERSAKYNVVAVSYVDPDQKFSVQQVIYPETEEERQVYIDLDGGRENKLEATFPTITNYAIAKDFARLLFNKSRRQETCSITVSSKALNLEPGDCIRIQSNILNFGTDPWRIVSFKLNDNMSIDLGCVRNPDDIYPYVRVGEEDYVTAVYVPRGSTIYYPNTQALPAIGLVPPSHALYPNGFNPSNTHPGPTDPYGPSGGGAGGGANSSTENNAPLNPQLPTSFTAYLQYKSSTITDFGNGSYNFNLTFIQPSGVLYSMSRLYWRANEASPFQEIVMNTRPGDGKEIYVTIGPLPKGTYQYYLRSYSTDGYASTTVLEGQFGYTDALAEDPTFSGFLGLTTNLVTIGWSITTPRLNPPSYDDLIDTIFIKPKSPNTNPRKVTVSMKQIGNIINTTINRNIRGVRIFYKEKTSDYWSYEDYDFKPDYIPGATVTFDLAATFGALVTSTIPANSVNDILQRYSFAARLTYLDASLGTKLVGPGDSVVEQYNGSTNYKMWGTTTDSVTKVSCVNLPTDWANTFKTADQNPDATINTIADMVPAIRYITFNSSQDFRISFYRPSFTRFRGYRIYYRAVIEGPTQDYQIFETGQGYNNFIDGRAIIDIELPFQFDPAKYLLGYVDFVIVALYSTSSGIVEANYALASRVSVTVFNAFASTDNIYDTLAFTLKETQLVNEQVRTTWPATPVINPKSWIKFTDVKNTNNYGREIAKYNNQYYINQYYNLTFDMPATATALIVYRRWFTPNGLSDGTKYLQGIGPWERIRIPEASVPVTGSGFRIVNLRPAIFYDYFNTDNTVNSLYGASGSWPLATDPNKLSGIYPILGAGSGVSGGSEFAWQQFLFVIEDSNVELTTGLLLKSFKTAEDDLYNSLPLVPAVDGFTVGNVPRDLVVGDTGIYNTMFTSGSNRRLSQAITRPDNDKITRSTNNSASDDPYGPFPPARTAVGSAFSVRLQGPRGGGTVY